MQNVYIKVSNAVQNVIKRQSSDYHNHTLQYKGIKRQPKTCYSSKENDQMFYAKLSSLFCFFVFFLFISQLHIFFFEENNEQY